MRFDLLMIILGAILALAMVLTLIYGKDHGRHGYGLTAPGARHVLAVTRPSLT